MPLIIGITGSIATGKSSACKVITELGAVHCDADRLVHRMYDPGKPAFYRIVEHFGDDIVGADGFIDRKILGSKVFGKPSEMRKLTTAIGNIAEEVKKVIDEWNESLKQNDVALLEAVNLIEAGYGRWCHQVWLFASNGDTAQQRLMARNQFSLEEAEQRMASQRHWEERAPASDVVFFNDKGLEDFEAEVKEKFARLQGLWSNGQVPPSKYNGWWEMQVR